jgi:uncharacterized membrane protein (DUF2068 family)
MIAANAPTTPAPSHARQRLPITLYVLAGLILLKAVLLAGLVLGATFQRVREFVAIPTIVDWAEALETIPWAPAFILGFAGLLAMSVALLLSRRRTGWLLAMVLTGLFIALDIYGFLNGISNHLWQVLNIITVFYLNQRDVREAVGATARPGTGVGEDGP